MAVANRRDSPRSPVAEEPFDLQARFRALDKHWSGLERVPDVPQRWEPAYDTQLVPPLLKAQPLAGNDATADSWTSGGDKQDSTSKLVLNPEQELAADNKFKYYLATRAHKVSYLKEHPPQPIGFAPVAKQPLALHMTWETLFDDGKVEAGRPVSFNRLADDQAWRPIYRLLDTERIPFDWEQPGKEDTIMGLSQEEWDAHMLESDARMKAREERSVKVTAWRDEVRPAREAKEQEEFERIQRERVEAELERKKREL